MVPKVSEREDPNIIKIESDSGDEVSICSPTMETDVMTLSNQLLQEDGSSDTYEVCNIDASPSMFSSQSYSLKEILVPSDSLSLHALAKDRQKKDNHNMIERRRRFNINDRIKELGTLLPRHDDPYYELVRDLRRNKGTILRASVAYLRYLKNDVTKIPRMEEKQRLLEVHNRKLLYRVQELEKELRSHGVPVTSQPELYNLPVQSSPSYSHMIEEQEDSNTRQDSNISAATPPTSPSSGGSSFSPFRDYDELIAEDEDGPVTSNDPLLSSSQDTLFTDFILN